MREYAFLIVSLIIAVVGIGFYYLGPVLERWHKRLEADLSRLKKGGEQQEPPDS